MNNLLIEQILVSGKISYEYKQLQCNGSESNAQGANIGQPGF